MIGAVAAFFEGLFRWIANNRAVQWILGAIVFVFALILWGERREKQGVDKQKLKQERRENEIRQKAEAHVREVVKEERKMADDAQSTGGSGRVPDSRSMSDEEFYLYFGYHRTPREVGD